MILSTTWPGSSLKQEAARLEAMDVTKLNLQQANALAQLRDAVKDCNMQDSSDVFLLRWLIARDFDVQKAEKMLRASLEWRAQYRINTLLQDFTSPEVFKKYFAAGFTGVDKAHNPLWVVRYGRIDMKGILQSAKKKDYFYHVYSLVESSVKFAKDYQEKLDLPSSVITQSTIIFDLEDFAMRHITYKPVMDSAIQVIQFYEANYPEFLRRVFIVNAPKIFNIAFAMIKPFLNEATAQKIKILSGNDASQWKKSILEEVDADQLPVHYGGTLADPDGNPHCITKVNMGGTVPESYYFNKQMKLNSNNNKKNLTVANGTKQKLEFAVKDHGLKIRWDFYSEEGDIAFGIYKKKGNEKMFIVPKDRVDCHIVSEEGEIPVEPGQYVIEFDNSFSYLRSKIIWYSIDVDAASNDQNGSAIIR